MFIGAVKWFNNTKGFGILSLPEGVDLFVHIRGFRNPAPGTIHPHQVVVGEKRWDALQNKDLANNCRLLGDPGDWPIVMSLLDTAATVYLTNKTGQYRKRDLMALAADQLLIDKEAEAVYGMVVSETGMLQPHRFIRYARFVEQALVRGLAKDTSTAVLPRIFQHFGACIGAATLFAVWKAKCFQYIGYPDPGDYEIPEEVFNLHATEIGYADLCRIRTYSFGEAFCAEFAQALLDGSESADREERESLFPYLDFLEADERAYWAGVFER